MDIGEAARLQAATSSGKPVLLRIHYDAGRGFGAPKRQRNELSADIYAFLFQQLEPGKGSESKTPRSGSE